MEPHRPPSLPRDSSEKRARSPRRDALPLGREWLEREAIRYVARWESTRRGVTEVLERAIERRCARSGEDPEPTRAAIEQVVSSLVERKYLDDRRFATQLYERLRRQGRSRSLIHGRLRAKGVGESLIRKIEEERATQRTDNAQDEQHTETEPHAAHALDEELEAAWSTARKKRLGPYTRDPLRRAAERQRQLAVLARQGFSEETACAVVDAEVSEPFSAGSTPMTRPTCRAREGER